MWHLHRVNLCSHMVAHEKQFCIRVVDNVVDLFRHEFVQDRHGNSSVGQRGKKSHCPLV